MNCVSGSQPGLGLIPDVAGVGWELKDGALAVSPLKLHKNKTKQEQTKNLLLGKAEAGNVSNNK